MRSRVAGALIALALVAGVLTIPGQADPTGRATLLGVFRWHVAEAWFGGVSGIDLSEDGIALTAITDRGKVITATLSRDAEGRVIGVTGLRADPLRSSKGAALTGANADAEGLAMAVDGTIYLSFEGNHRVMRHATPDAAGVFLPRAGFPTGLQRNSGLEALAVDGRGDLWTLPERSGGVDRPFPVFRFDGAAWRPAFRMTREGGFLPVGADFGPDGRLYILERAFTGFGFAARLRRFDPGGTGVQSGEVLFQSRTGRHDNLEGVAIWRDAAGRLRATMVSDDNFHMLQRTELVEYLLPD